MINFIQRLAITLLIFSSLSNIASAQMTDEAEVESIPTKSQAENFPVEEISSLPAKPKLVPKPVPTPVLKPPPKPKPKQGIGKCISNCSLLNARSYIRRNFDGRERTVRITVTYDNNGKVTDVQINPSTGNLFYDLLIRIDALRLRFSPGKSGTQTFNFNIVGQRSGIFSSANSYIKRNFDGRERTVRITVTYNNSGRVTNVQINPSTGNSSYDRVIRRDARRLRFSPGKSGTQTFNFNIVESGSQRAREAQERQRENKRRRREAEERRKQQEEAEKQNNNQSQP
ncbi:MAG: energy transducer TonB [Cyanobacteria bacterium P01_D01_bin.116]